MKVRNLFIIFVLSYLLLFVVCGVLEFLSVGRTANDIMTMVQTAADMALDQVEATDEFFTTGGGYLQTTSGTLDTTHEAYQVLVPHIDGEYHRVDLYPTLTGKTDLGDIFESVYEPSKFRAFLNSHEGIKGIGFVGGTFTYNPTVTVSDVDVPTRGFSVNWFRVPTVARLGDSLTGGWSRNRVYSYATSGYGTTYDNVTRLWELYGLSDAASEVYVDGSPVTYYLTPLNLGITYLNEDILQSLFMNNMDLLMRSKYAHGGYDLNSEECGNGVLKTAFYANLVDESFEASGNPINNGSFTLVRGPRRPSTAVNGQACFYKGIAPKVEYAVLDMYDDRNNAILQYVFGPRFQDGRVLSGSELKLLDGHVHQTYSGLTGYPASEFAEKPFVLAKVTFYAEVIVPYTLPLLREMRGRFDGVSGLSARTLFNPFSATSAVATNLTALSGNYVDIDTAVPGFSEARLRTVLNEEHGVLQKGTYGDVVSYTTYFAVTP